MCGECGGSGTWTHIFNVSYHADVNFELGRELIPKDVMGIIEFLGLKTLSSKDRAEIFRMPFVIEDARGQYPIIAFLPIAKAEITVAGRPEEMVVAGLQGDVVDIAPYLGTAMARSSRPSSSATTCPRPSRCRP